MAGSFDRAVEDADGEVGEFGLGGFLPGAVGGEVEAFEAISRDVLAEAELGFVGEIGIGGGEGFDEPVGDAEDDLADAGLGDADFVGDGAGAGSSMTCR